MIFVVPTSGVQVPAGYSEYWNKLAFDLANCFCFDYEAETC